MLGALAAGTHLLYLYLIGTELRAQFAVAALLLIPVAVVTFPAACSSSASSLVWRSRSSLSCAITFSLLGKQMRSVRPSSLFCAPSIPAVASPLRLTRNQLAPSQRPSRVTTDFTGAPVCRAVPSACSRPSTAYTPAQQGPPLVHCR